MQENMQNMQKYIHDMQINMLNNMKQYAQYPAYANKHIFAYCAYFAYLDIDNTINMHLALIFYIL